ncbi:DUF3800 domain-containing protein [Cobetia sp. D5]|uniref:DUF3800 domain-containing protein n=1 Tax=Cobetia TaxID=204286 RepID=UPI00254FFEAE|nr:MULTISPECIES: DUF3800 domain-containing protein [Cobetia]
MQLVDINEIRDLVIAHEKFDHVDDNFTFYYDESNNIRKLHLTTRGLNVNKAGNFVLAGIVHKGSYHSANFDTLIINLKLQKSTNEVKLKHIGRGSFVDILKSKTLSILLQWLIDNELYIHCFTLNVLYWSITDIVDSIIENLTEQERCFYITINQQIKNDLYKVILSNEELFLEKLREFDYPDIKPNKIKDFSIFLVAFVQNNSESLDRWRRNNINMFVEKALNSDELLFVMDEEKHILISDFFTFYLRNVFLFKNSNHIFDVEKEIESIFNQTELLDRGETIKNYSFVDSKESVEVQISDILAGLFAKYSAFLTDTKHEHLDVIRSNLDSQQRTNMQLLKILIDKSDEVSRGFFHRVVSEDEVQKNIRFMHSKL